MSRLTLRTPPASNKALHRAARLAVTVLVAAFSSIGLATTAAAATFSNGNPIVVSGTPGAPSPSAYPSLIAASGLAGPASNVRVSLHSLTDSDSFGIDILLVAPNGQNVVLMSDVCNELAAVTLTFDDGAAAPPPVGGPCPTGVYKPFDGAGTTANFSPEVAGPYGTTLAPLGGTPNGTWKLYVRNNGGSTEAGGAINGGWSLELLEPIQPEFPPQVLAPRFCNGVFATMVGTEAPHENIVGTPENDVIVGLGGNDSIKGLGGNDRICGGTGNDKLFGQFGKDRLFGGAGNDRLTGGSGRDSLDGGSGRDRCLDAGSGPGPLDEGRTTFISCEL